MTREEALKELAEWREQMKNHGVPDYGKKLMALGVAIEALSNADRSTEWIPFTKRPLTDEEKEEYPDWIYILDCPLPDDEEEILLSNGKHVWTDTFIDDGECYLDGGDDIDEGMAWMPLPDPWNGGEEE